MIQAHDHTSMTVGDMDVMLAFYRDHFNMKVLKLIENKNDGERAKGSGFEGLHMKIAHLALGGFVLEMVEYVNRKGAKLDMRPTNIGSHHMGFVCDDIHATYEAMIAKGVRFKSPPYGWGGDSATNCYGVDPEGNRFELMDRPTNR